MQKTARSLQTNEEQKNRSLARRREASRMYRKEHSDKVYETNRAYVRANSETVKERDKRYREINKERTNILKSKYYQDNKVEILEKRAKYAAENADKVREKNRMYAINNRDKFRTYGIKRYTKRTVATPPWNDREAMQAIYDLAAYLNEIAGPAHVDHVVPLQGKLVSGLHVHTNLQILPGAWNRLKGNKWQIE